VNKIIVHISEVNISTESGMGRVEYYWKKAFEKAGYNFIHIGPDEVGRIKHKGLFGFKARSFYRKLNIRPNAFIVHEPASGFFVNKEVPCFVESHGIERRQWETGNTNFSNQKISLKTKFFFPIWRLRMCDKGLKNADLLFVINSDDKLYAEKKYNRSSEDVYLFKNGYDAGCIAATGNQPETFTVLFNGSWLKRKGVDVLVKAAEILYHQKLQIKYLLIGVGKSESEVVNDWPVYLKDFLTVIPYFNKKEEAGYINAASVFALPSFSEGQPLSLLQAMASGKCCVTTNCCGQKDIITHNKNGLLFQPGDAKTMAALIGDCYYNAQLVDSIGKEARLSVNARTWENVSDELVRYVERFLQQRYYK
jgi:glycosyltransferase involved in cell wall biosynthesis